MVKSLSGGWDHVPGVLYCSATSGRVPCHRFICDMVHTNCWNCESDPNEGPRVVDPSYKLDHLHIRLVWEVLHDASCQRFIGWNIQLIQLVDQYFDPRTLLGLILPADIMPMASECFAKSVKQQEAECAGLSSCIHCIIVLHDFHVQLYTCVHMLGWAFWREWDSSSVVVAVLYRHTSLGCYIATMTVWSGLNLRFPTAYSHSAWDRLDSCLWQIGGTYCRFVVLFQRLHRLWTSMTELDLYRILAGTFSRCNPFVDCYNIYL